MLSFHSVILFLVLARNIVQSSVQPSSGYTEGYIEGDIFLTPEQQRFMEATASPSYINATQNAVVRYQQSLWQGGMVPYILDNLNSQAINATMEAIADYHSLTCIRFVQRVNQEDYVRFFSGRGCYSYIGRIGGPQDISIGRGCEFKGVVIHEMFHALGRWHEQSRPDRDMFVRILSENILSGTESNFKVVNAVYATTQGVPYDIGSIMHYSSRAFSRNGLPTIVPVDTNISPNQLGQRRGLSNHDIQHVTTLYCGNGGSTASWSSWTSWSSCSRTCNGGIKSRTRTCIGGTTCDGSNIETQQCNPTSCQVVASWSSWTAWSGCSQTCGRGRQLRIRSCVGGNTCLGTKAEFKDCNTQYCPIIATWTSWGGWSSCSSTCQGGFQQRRRTCQNGNTCPGTHIMSKNCNTRISCEVQPNPNSGEWSTWSACSAQCGGGSRFRVQLCGGSDCKVNQEHCNTHDCEPEPELKGIKYHGCWYFNSRSDRISLLERTTPELSDNPLTREKPVRKCGVAAQKLNFDFFGITLGYCLSGTNRLSDYQYYASSLCRDGRGAYRRSSFIMDVYEITDGRSFSDSVMLINNPNWYALNSTTTTNVATSTVATDTVTDSMEESSSGSGDMDGTSSGYVSTYDIIVLLSAVLTVMLATMVI